MRFPHFIHEIKKGYDVIGFNVFLRKLVRFPCKKGVRHAYYTTNAKIFPLRLSETTRNIIARLEFWESRVLHRKTYLNQICGWAAERLYQVPRKPGFRVKVAYGKIDCCHQWLYTNQSFFLLQLCRLGSFLYMFLHFDYNCSCNSHWYTWRHHHMALHYDSKSWNNNDSKIVWD